MNNRKSTLKYLGGMCVSLFMVAGAANANVITNNYSTPGTNNFTVPVGVTQITVRAWGAGGAPRNDGTTRRGGGGGGAFAQSTLAVVPGSNYTIVVGAGGIASTSGDPGNPGGFSLFHSGVSTQVLARGGSGGSNTGGAGGSAGTSIGQITFSGGNGGDRSGSTSGGGGGGGGSATPTGPGSNGGNGSGASGGAGGAGQGDGGAGGNNTQPGEPGSAPGGGGGARGSDGGNGGNGAAGLVQIIYSLPPPEKVGFVTPVRIVNAGSTSPFITIQVQDNLGNPAVATNNIEFSLSSSLSGFFRNADDTTNITSVFISNNFSSVSFRYTSTNVGTHILTVTDLSGVLSSTNQFLIISPFSEIVQTYYVPVNEEAMRTYFTNINSGVSNPTNVAVIGISVFASNTIIVVDHWEDGYESDLNNPTQSTTRVWGDGNAANGCAPGVVPCTDLNDILQRGQFIGAVTNINAQPRNPAVIAIDGRDKIGANRPIALTRMAWPAQAGIGSLLGDASEVFDTSTWGTRYVFPVGTNVVPSITPGVYNYSMASIMARTNGTVVVIDRNSDGIPEVVTNLNEGQVFNYENIISGGTVTSSAPVQVHILTGIRGSSYAARWYTIPPIETWSSELYNPVAITRASYTNLIALFNPNTNPITIFAEFVVAGSNTIVSYNVPARGHTFHTNAIGSTNGVTFQAHRFFTTNNAPFYGSGIVDAVGATGQLYDWGYGLVPKRLLSTVLLLGYAPGQTPGITPDGVNRHPVFVTANRATMIYVDFNGDGGAFSNDCGEYDIAIPIQYLESIRIYDPDGDQSGMKLFTCDGAEMAAAWGQDPSRSFSGDTLAMDVGYTVLPLPSILAEKEVDFSPGGDLNNDGFLNPAEIIRYTITITNPTLTISGGIFVRDELPPEVIYVENSTFLDGNPVLDSGFTPFPLDETGLFIGTLEAGESRTLYFDATVLSPYTSTVSVITNQAFVSDDVSTIIVVADITVPVFVRTLDIEKSSDAGGFVTNGQFVTYTILVENTGTVTQTNVQLTDTLPFGMTYVPGSTLVTAPTGGVPSVAASTNTVRDEFSVVSYSNNNGTADFASPWVEDGDDNNPASGQIRISGNALVFSNNVADRSIYRTVNYVGANSATVTFSFARSAGVDTADSMLFQVSTNNGVSYTTISNFTGVSGANSGNASFNVLASASTNTRFRFAVPSGSYASANEVFTVDDFQVRWTTPAIAGSNRGTNTFAGTAPPVLHTGQELRPGEFMTVTFVAQTTNNIFGISNFVNVACVTSMGNTNLICDDVLDLGFLTPTIQVVKTVSENVYPGSDILVGTNNTPITYWFVVSNPGTAPLTNVMVNDPLIPFSTNIGNLGVGQAVTVSVSTVLSGNLTNVAIATGQYLSQVVTNSDIAEVVIINPGIAVVKTVSTTGLYPGSNYALGTNGQAITYWFVVSNTGDVPLADVTLDDLDLAFSTNVGTLVAGQSVTVSVSSVISGYLLNTVIATGEYPLDNIHSDEDTAEVDEIDPAISIIKLVSADGTFGNAANLVVGTNDQSVTYYFVISNIGNTLLTNVTLIDNDLTPPVNQSLGDLTVGQTITASVVSVISGSLTNTATATGDDPLGNPHSDDDDAEVQVISPSITLTKLVDGVDLVIGTNDQA
ncbi:MAG TPA: hypothetical protein PJ991_11940, partial [Kiritimatiellia bacterium]|nr:hypothetical protein [Kiritimatiellia bacterium]